ncbi:MAG: hypothetical protein OXH08_07195 [Gammaproteobacteria bacterium]|nr:hypothetical protein [Gammaproteobacteria bacterium]
MTTTDFTIEADEIKNCEYSFRLSPALWDQYRGPDELEWKCATFSRRYLDTIPEAPGVYAFCVRPSIGGGLCGSYLLYVGKTERGLRTRCREYLANAEADSERPKLQRMLRRFFRTDYLHFCFAVVREGDPVSIEDALLEATVPPACTTLPASIRSAVAAF